jgi:hypothetical protein
MGLKEDLISEVGSIFRSPWKEEVTTSVYGRENNRDFDGSSNLPNVASAVNGHASPSVWTPRDRNGLTAAQFALQAMATPRHSEINAQTGAQLR